MWLVINSENVKDVKWYAEWWMVYGGWIGVGRGLCGRERETLLRWWRKLFNRSKNEWRVLTTYLCNFVQVICVLSEFRIHNFLFNYILHYPHIACFHIIGQLHSKLNVRVKINLYLRISNEGHHHSNQWSIHDYEKQFFF